jgi:hypothetical protein
MGLWSHRLSVQAMPAGTVISTRGNGCAQQTRFGSSTLAY